VRIESEQQLSMKPLARHTATSKARAPKWAPQNAKKEAGAVEVVEPRMKPQTSEVQTVVEYLVMQTRVMEGKEEDWKIWGFATETTPAKMDEDELYWKRMLAIQSAA
jgi:protein MBA1